MAKPRAIRRQWWRKLGHGSLLLVATVYCVFPIYFMLVQSLKTAQEDVAAATSNLEALTVS